MAASTKDLEDLLSSMFSTDELRRFLRHQGGAVEALVEELPENPVPKASFMHEAAQKLTGRGLADKGFFDALVAKIPGRKVDIARVSVGAPATAAPSPARSSGALPVAVALTALEVEFEAVRAHLDDVREEVHPSGTVYDVGLYPKGGPRWRVALAQIGARNAGAAANVERAIAFFNPALALFVGVAGGLKDVKSGDVVCASKVYGYESGKDTAEGFLPRPVAFPTHDGLLQRVKAESRAWNRGVAPTFRVWEGPIAAGEAVVAGKQSETAQRLLRLYGDALAVEMEGAGFLEGAHLSHLPALVVRGISDLLDGKAEADAGGGQDQASAHAAAFALRVLGAWNPNPR